MSALFFFPRGRDESKHGDKDENLNKFYITLYKIILYLYLALSTLVLLEKDKYWKITLMLKKRKASSGEPVRRIYFLMRLSQLF